MTSTKNPEPKSKPPWTQSFYWFAGAVGTLVAAALGIYQLVHSNDSALPGMIPAPITTTPPPAPTEPRPPKTVSPAQETPSPLQAKPDPPHTVAVPTVIRLSRISGPAGTTVVVSGAGFLSGETVRVDFPKAPFQDTRADPKGSFSGVKFEVPDLPLGPVFFKARGLSSDRRPDPAKFKVVGKRSSQ